MMHVSLSTRNPYFGMSHLLPKTIGHIQQQPDYQYVAHEFTDRHAHDRRPEWQLEPTGQGADRIRRCPASQPSSMVFAP